MDMCPNCLGYGYFYEGSIYHFGDPCFLCRGRGMALLSNIVLWEMARQAGAID